MFTIYCLTNSVNGKKYIGVTNNLQKRMREHKSVSNKKYYITNAIRKYGWNAFEMTIIDETDDKIEAYKVLEPKYIMEMGSNVNGYNLTEGGDGVPGYIMTEEHREKLRYEKTPEHREKIRKTLTGRKNPKHSERMKGHIPWNKGKGKIKVRVRKPREPEASAHMNVQRYVCHCGAVTNKGNYTRWHGEKCKGIV